MRQDFIINLAAITLAEVAGLTRIPIALLGNWVKGTRFSITRADLKTIVENFRKRQTGETVIDYEHASEFPEVAQGNPIPAAGWVQEIDDEPDEHGVLWGLAKFTQRAREMISNGEYKYLSPSINWAARDKHTGEQQGATLTSVALVNRPFLEAMPAVQLSETGWHRSEGGHEMPTTLADLDRRMLDLTERKMRENPKLSRLEALWQVGHENSELMRQRHEKMRHGDDNPEPPKFTLKEIEDYLDGKIRLKMREQPSLRYIQAVQLVASENCDLMERRRALICSGGRRDY